jgi:hypothetical protein
MYWGDWVRSEADDDGFERQPTGLPELPREIGATRYGAYCDLRPAALFEARSEWQEPSSASLSRASEVEFECYDTLLFIVYSSTSKAPSLPRGLYRLFRRMKRSFFMSTVADPYWVLPV